MFETPILFLIFNRPEQTKKVFSRIREIAPAFLYVVADGPREGNSLDQYNCKLAREIITGGVDWPCEVKTIFRDKNLGCGLSPSDGITWFFQQVEEGIILEDDCLPSVSFFNYCKTLLNFYRDNHQVMHISGSNFQNGNPRTENSYYFSVYTHSWGWATWQNRWAAFRFDMSDYTDQLIASISKSYGFEQDEIIFWQNSFRELVENNRTDIWDFRWMYAVWKNKGVSVLPEINLVKNIGFDQQATHTHIVYDNIKSLSEGELQLITHPKGITLNRKADRYSFKNHFNPKFTLQSKVINLFNKVIKIVKSALLPIKVRFQFSYFSDFTMIPKSAYVANLELCSEFKRVAGDVVECGTWKGGMIAGMVSIMGSDRVYYLFDSFEGLPEAKEIDGTSAKIWQSNKKGVDYFDNCRAEESDAKKAMDRSGAKTYNIHKGWFNESLKAYSSTNGIAILRLDADWYESTMDCLVQLFPKINFGGILIVDDYYTWEGCSKAIHDYLSSNKLPYRINSYKGICYIEKK